MAEDWTDRHIARWHNHWIGVEFDESVEGITVRINRLWRHLDRTTRQTLDQAGIDLQDYNALHMLMIRDTPGTASPTDLARDLGLSPAGMTGRLDTLEAAQLVQRRAHPDDRRRVSVEVTKAGADLWRGAMAQRGAAETELVHSLSEREQAQLVRLLRKMTLSIGDD